MNAPDLQAIDLTPINRFEEFEPLYQRGDKLFDLGSWTNSSTPTVVMRRW